MSYLISLGAGLVVGLLYYFSRVQSPAPPLVALAGLLGIVIGEHAIPFVQAQLRAPQAQTSSVQHAPAAPATATQTASVVSDASCNNQH